MKIILAECFAIFVLFVLPIGLGLLSIALPFRVYLRKKKDSALTVGILNSVFCGLSVLELVGTLLFHWFPSFVPHAIIACGALAMLAVVWKKKEPIQPPEPTRGTGP